MPGVTLCLAALTPVAHHCPSHTGILATSVKLVLATMWFSSFSIGQEEAVLPWCQGTAASFGR